MRSQFQGLVGVALVLVPVPWEIRAEDVKSELEGTWVLVSFERDGKVVKPSTETRAIITQNKFVIKTGETVVAAGTFKVDPSKQPKASETTYTEGMEKGKTFKGIYELNGDMLKLCRAGTPDDERPTEFKSKEGSKQFVAIYRRAKR
jgi:uncharacterized protein (TIGR03067 family)